MDYGKRISQTNLSLSKCGQVAKASRILKGESSTGRGRSKEEIFSAKQNAPDSI
jgi:hypothetical protein